MNEDIKKTPLSDTELQEQINPLGARKGILLSCLMITVIAFITAAIIMQFSEAYSSTYYTLIGILVATFVLMGILVFLLINTQTKIDKLVHENITKGVLEEIFEIMVHEPDRQISQGILENTKLISGWNQSSGNDYVKGKYKGYDITFCDIKLTKEKKRTDSDGEIHEKIETIFKGQWVIMDHDRKLTSPLYVKERLVVKKSGKTLQGLEIETENTDFNAQFQMFSPDGQIAFQILTPHFMEFIISADVKVHGKTFMYFDSNTIHIAIHNDKDLLQTSNISLDGVVGIRRRQRSELKYLTDILDELIQNDYLFKKNKRGESNG